MVTDRPFMIMVRKNKRKISICYQIWKMISKLSHTLPRASFWLETEDYMTAFISCLTKRWNHIQARVNSMDGSNGCRSSTIKCFDDLLLHPDFEVYRNGMFWQIKSELYEYDKKVSDEHLAEEIRALTVSIRVSRQNQGKKRSLSPKQRVGGALAKSSKK